jgi:hypothetical protein
LLMAIVSLRANPWMVDRKPRRVSIWAILTDRTM